MGNEMLKANEIKAEDKGKTIISYFVVKSSNQRMTTNNSKFLQMVLADKTGEIDAKFWDVPQKYVDMLIVGAKVKVRAINEPYQGKPQLNVQEAWPITPEDDVSIEDLIQSVPMDVQEMKTYIEDTIESMEDEDFKNVTKTIWSNPTVQKRAEYPAAQKMHHAVRGGLLYHVYRMLKLGEKFCEVYGGETPMINRSLLLSGIILHDVCKVFEMKVEQELLIVEGYTDIGQLLGHSVMGAIYVGETAKEVGMPANKKQYLQHMMISHHGKLEYGAAKEPMFIEATLLHMIDMIDSRVYMIEDATKDLGAGEISDKIWALNTPVLKTV